MNFSSIENGARRKSVELLYWYLQNPGMFSILILGNAGVGKSHWVKVIQEDIAGDTACAEDVVEVNLSLADPTKTYWEKTLKEANGKILVIKELEKVGPHDHLLFEGLSTSNGLYGFEKKEYSIRIVFTSSYSIDALRITEDLISHRLFDRISQLVVRFPSFDEANRGVWKDFKATWKKMNFSGRNKIPGQNLRNWLESSSHTLKGNFRDLDKIAILWHQFRLMEMPEEKILTSVLDQLQMYSAFPEQHTDLEDAFYFQKGKTKKQTEEEFKAAFKRWVKRTYGSLRKAAGPMQMSHRTMEKW